MLAYSGGFWDTPCSQHHSYPPMHSGRVSWEIFLYSLFTVLFLFPNKCLELKLCFGPKSNPASTAAPDKLFPQPSLTPLLILIPLSSLHHQSFLIILSSQSLQFHPKLCSFLAALAALYLTLVSEWVSDSVGATLEFWHKEWLLTLQTLQTFDQSDVWTERQRD